LDPDRNSYADAAIRAPKLSSHAVDTISERDGSK